MSRVPTYFILCFFILTACSNSDDDNKTKKDKPHLVETVKVEEKSLGITRVRTGTLRSLKEVKVFTQEEGQITHLPFYEGDTVKKGELVARLDDKLLSAQLNRTKATRIKAEKDLQRVQGLYKRKLVSDEELARAETEHQVALADELVLLTRKKYATIQAPISGVITERNNEAGNVATKYSHLLTIADPASLITTVNVSELVLVHLKLQDQTGVSIDALGTEIFPGEITRIHPKLDPVTHQGTIEVQLKSVPEQARPGQLCRVMLHTQISPRILIPFQALRSDAEGEYVFKLNEENHAIRTSVISGQRLDEHIEIVRGLRPGETVVTKGFLGLTPNKSVKPVNRESPSKTSQTSSTQP
ncbi:MAG: efflux RND transporter periplasmic adaptor subunit [Gammaproteobacteria bacterium]|nr:efflux RND transporter periplasmic adaptor subunit [Gammaproteobacteria bacterium]MDH5802535.1 efflux RND transporter periplasmic adaptor subunit [Gammaproteobacteria bacterium]